jgi:hypothetical protein
MAISTGLRKNKNQTIEDYIDEIQNRIGFTESTNLLDPGSCSSDTH